MSEAPPTQARGQKPDLNHDVYIATGTSLARYRAVPEGLEEVKRIGLLEDYVVGLGAFPDGVFLWLDGDWFGYSPDLELRNHRPLGHSYTYSEAEVGSCAGGALADLAGEVTLVDKELAILGKAKLPGYVDDMIVVDDLVYILDPTLNSHYLVKLDVSKPEPRVVEQVKFYQGPLSKGEHWLDLSSGRWFVLMQHELQVYSAHRLSEEPLARIPCQQMFDLRRLQGDSKSRFRVWRTTDLAPMWALGHDTEMAVAQLKVTPLGLQTVQRLALKPSDYPLMTAPFIERAGSRLYVSDGGDLSVIDISGSRPKLIQTMPFRYGLNIAILDRRRQPEDQAPGTDLVVQP